MSNELDQYLDLLSKAFHLEEGNVKLNAEVQRTAAKHLQGLWILDGLINCLELVLKGGNEEGSKSLC